MTEKQKVFIALTEIISDPSSYCTQGFGYSDGPHFCNMHSRALNEIVEVLDKAGKKEEFFGRRFSKMSKKSHPGCFAAEGCQTAKEMLWLAVALFVAHVR